MKNVVIIRDTQVVTQLYLCKYSILYTVNFKRTGTGYLLDMCHHHHTHSKSIIAHYRETLNDPSGLRAELYWRAMTHTACNWVSPHMHPKMDSISESV